MVGLSGAFHYTELQVGGTIDPYDMITGVRLVDKLSGAKVT